MEEVSSKGRGQEEPETGGNLGFPAVWREMGILDRIFGREDRETKTPNIKFDQLEDWIKNKLDTKNSATYSECREILDDVKDSVKDIRALVKRLEREGFQHNMPVKIYKIVKASKPKYMAGMLDILEKIEEKYPKKYTDLEEFHRILSESMLNISKISISHGRYLPMAFEDLIAEKVWPMKRLIPKIVFLGLVTA